MADHVEAEGGSRAPYIIICQGRIDLALATSGFEMIRASSRAAANLVTYYGDKLSYADTRPISDLQHVMMDVVSGKTTAGSHATDFQSASEMVDEMFGLLDALEAKMRS
jgi:hypothetical protein